MVFSPHYSVFSPTPSLQNHLWFPCKALSTKARLISLTTHQTTSVIWTKLTKTERVLLPTPFLQHHLWFPCQFKFFRLHCNSIYLSSDSSLKFFPHYSAETSITPVRDSPPRPPPPHPFTTVVLYTTSSCKAQLKKKTLCPIPHSLVYCIRISIISTLSL